MTQPPSSFAGDLEPTFRGFLTGHGTSPLAYARWEHPSPRGRVVISHGYGEHGERYAHTARWLHGQGWSVSAMDHLGFGRSPGVRGDARGIRPFVEDLAFFLRHERHHDAGRQGAPQILLGHSFGGLVALLTLLWHSDTLDGLILSSPAVTLTPIPFALKALQRVLLLLAPHRPLDLPNDKDLVCSDPAFNQRYWEDPLCHRFITAAFFAALGEGRGELLSLGHELDKPILLLDAGQDTVVDPDGSEALWRALRPGLLERHRLEGFRHEVFHDLGRREAEKLTNEWLDHVFSTEAGTEPQPAVILGTS